MNRIPRASMPVAALAGILVLAGCTSTSQEEPSAAGTPASPKAPGGKVTIVTDVYPTAYAAQVVGGDAVEVVLLTSPGVEPHDLELSPKQITQIAGADLVAYVPGMIPAVEQAATQEAADRAIDVTAGITRLTSDGQAAPGQSSDPHVWLDPTNMAAMGQNIARALTDRGLGTGWHADRLDQQMAVVDGIFTNRLADCSITPMVVSHAAFGYLAAAYGFEQHGISGLSPEAEPSPRKIAEISALVRDEGVTTIYVESLLSPAAASTIAAETGVTTATLDPIEGSTDGKDYLALMRENLDSLHAGQGCT